DGVRAVQNVTVGVEDGVPADERGPARMHAGDAVVRPDAAHGREVAARKCTVIGRVGGEDRVAVAHAVPDLKTIPLRACANRARASMGYGTCSGFVVWRRSLSPTRCPPSPDYVLDAAPSVDLHDVAGDEGGVVGGEKERRIGDVLRPGQAAERDRRLELLPHAGRRP